MPARLALAMSGIALGIVAWIWLRTLRLEVSRHPELDAFEGRPWVLCFHHGRQFPLLAWRRRRPTVVLVSHSRDGQVQSRALRVLGFKVVRGSSSRGGARGLAALVRILRETGSRTDAAFAIDGPRGPIGIVKEGALVAARAAGAVLIPMGSAARSAKVLERAWDRFAVALPWTRAAVVLGCPIEASDVDARDRLERAIVVANAEAETCVSPRV